LGPIPNPQSPIPNPQSENFQISKYKFISPKKLKNFIQIFNVLKKLTFIFKYI
jgi:hypothetical protein